MPPVTRIVAAVHAIITGCDQTPVGKQTDVGDGFIPPDASVLPFPVPAAAMPAEDPVCSTVLHGSE